jgi:integrase
MAKRDVNGLHHVFSKGHEYWYAWRGGPQISRDGIPAYRTPEFWAAYDRAVSERHIPEPGKFKSMVTLYRGSESYKKLQPSTKRYCDRWLDRIADDFGALSIAAFDNPRARKNIRQWRSQFAATPRKADMALQVLSLVCSHAVDPLGKLAVNPCEGIKALYSVDRSDKIWTDADIARIKPHCTPELANVIDLAAATGLRRGDLLRLSWSHISDDGTAIVITTAKSKHQREAVIPIYDELRALLAHIPKHSPIILTNSRGRPWTDGGFGSSFNDSKRAAGMADVDLHFHDLRGTAATKFYIAGLELRVIAEILAWEEDSVSKIIRKYVDRAAATKAVILQLNEARGVGRIVPTPGSNDEQEL